MGFKIVCTVKAGLEVLGTHVLHTYGDTIWNQHDVMISSQHTCGGKHLAKPFAKASCRHVGEEEVWVFHVQRLKD